MEAMHVIQILDSGITTGDLTMSDKGRSKVDPCDWILWVVHPDSGVKDITAINAKPGNPDVFQSGDPHRIGNSSNWRGKILCKIKEFTQEKYNIVWKDSNGNEYTYDPRILVNPKE